MSSSGVVDAASADDFTKILESAARNLTVVHFWASWAPQCEQMNTVMSELAKDVKMANVKFVKLEAESIPEVSEQYEISAVPTFIFIKNKTVIDRLDGANAPAFTKKLQEHSSLLSHTPAQTPAPPTQQEDLNTRLKKLINAAPVMLFMKGNADTPRCGFSKQMIAILKENDVKFSTFDILSDEDVRQGLKSYSDWPTYPQLYANGELLGGLDIVKELVEGGELMSSLPAQQSLDDRLKGLINKAQVVLFMKGDVQTPRCGFSKTTVSILNDTGVKYDTFDILQDEDVRQGLKKFSNWPTYPQLYVKGDLVGGLDIIKELKESGELEEVLKAS